MYLVGVLRVDYLAMETAIPLAFHAKAGLGYALWWTTSGGKLARVDGVVGEGVSYGYHAALGASSCSMRSTGPPRSRWTTPPASTRPTFTASST